MNEKEVLFHWNYYQTLERKLENTTQYVSHDYDKDNECYKFGEAYSFEFQQLLILASVEFESILKLLCDSQDKEGIIPLTNKTLQNYPHIKEIKLVSPFADIIPLKDWEVDFQSDKNQKVKGIKWWTAYTNIKHWGHKNFFEANLENVIYAMASLYVVELYYVQSKLLRTVGKETSYFSSDYQLYDLAGSGPMLPGIKW